MSRYDVSYWRTSLRVGLSLNRSPGAYWIRTIVALLASPVVFNSRHEVKVWPSVSWFTWFPRPPRYKSCIRIERARWIIAYYIPHVACWSLQCRGVSSLQSLFPRFTQIVFPGYFSDSWNIIMVLRGIFSEDFGRIVDQRRSPNFEQTLSYTTCFWKGWILSKTAPNSLTTQPRC